MDFTSLGLLILRAGLAGTIAFRHGLAKLLDFATKMQTFPDPLGIGSTASLSLSISAEFLCGILLIVGIFTRYAAVPLIINMAVAFFIVHGSDPFQKKELALVYLIGFTAILAAGPGRFSADSIFRGIK